MHRLVWHPDDFDNGRLTTSAFRKEDLMGNECNYISVSRIDKIQPDIERQRARNQAERTNGNNFIRDEAYSIEWNCGEVRDQKDAENTAMFDITEEPTKENPAHCGIRNISGKTGRLYINELRTVLVNLSTEPIRLEIFLGSLKSN